MAFKERTPPPSSESEKFVSNLIRSKAFKYLDGKDGKICPYDYEGEPPEDDSWAKRIVVFATITGAGQTREPYTLEIIFAKDANFGHWLYLNRPGKKTIENSVAKGKIPDNSQALVICPLRNDRTGEIYLFTVKIGGLPEDWPKRLAKELSMPDGPSEPTLTTAPPAAEPERLGEFNEPPVAGPALVPRTPRIIAEGPPHGRDAADWIGKDDPGLKDQSPGAIRERFRKSGLPPDAPRPVPPAGAETPRSPHRSYGGKRRITGPRRRKK